MLPVCPALSLLATQALLFSTPPTCNLDYSPAGRAHSRAPVAKMARVYADVNQNMPRSYWDYDSVNIGTLRPGSLSLSFHRVAFLLVFFFSFPFFVPCFLSVAALRRARARAIDYPRNLLPNPYTEQGVMDTDGSRQAGASWKTTRS